MSSKRVLNTILSNILKDMSFANPYGLPSASDMFSMLSDAKSIFKAEDTILSLEGEFEVVGDIHGDLESLLTIFENNGYPDQTKYIFLGDYIHRGNYSIEVVLVLFSLKVLFPDNIYLIKGNHEISHICKNFNFYEDCVDRVNCNFFKTIRRIFRILPLGAVVNGEVFCAHGGIPDTELKLSEFSNIERPISKDYKDISDEILWSDPRSNVFLGEFSFNSVRSVGNFFGPEALKQFFERNGLSYLVRGHEVCSDGFKIPFEGCVTVFSSANYVGTENIAATCTIGKDKSVSAETFEKDVGSLSGFKSLMRESEKSERISPDILLLEEIPFDISLWKTDEISSHIDEVESFIY